MGSHCGSLLIGGRRLILGLALLLRHIRSVVVIRQRGGAGRGLPVFRGFRLYRICLDGLLQAAGVRALGGIGFGCVRRFHLDIQISLAVIVDIHIGITALGGIIGNHTGRNVGIAAEPDGDPNGRRNAEQAADGDEDDPSLSCLSWCMPPLNIFLVNGTIPHFSVEVY